MKPYTNLLNKPHVSVFLLGLLLWNLFSCNSSDTSPCVDKNCSDYSSHAEAQADFQMDPGCRNDLDGDNDGIACEQWFGIDENPGGCPSTANCGCSNKRKAECESTCCRWVVGTGCRCSS